MVNIAFPEIMTSLRVDLDVMQWVQTGYMIMQAVIMPSVGWVGARLGNRRVYLLALAVFVGGSALSGLAWDVSSLIAFRLVQAVGGGLLFPTSQVILFETFPEDKRGLAMGVSSLGFSLGPMMGPGAGRLPDRARQLACGVLYQRAGGRSSGLILAYLILPTAPRQSGRPLDVPGMLTLAAFLVSLAAGRQPGQRRGLGLAIHPDAVRHRASSPGPVSSSPSCATSSPLWNLRLFQKPGFFRWLPSWFSSTASALWPPTLLLSCSCKSTWITRPLQTAWMMMPSAVVIGVLSVGAGRLSDLLPGKILIIFGLGAVTFCLIQYASITALTSVGTITLWLTARGFARAFTHRAAVRGVVVGPGRIRGAHGIRPAESQSRHRQHRQRGAWRPRCFRTAWRSAPRLLAQDHMLAPLGADKLLDSLTTTFQHLGDLNQAAQMKSLAVLHDLGQCRGRLAQLSRHLSAHRRHHRLGHYSRPVDGQGERSPQNKELHPMDIQPNPPQPTQTRCWKVAPSPPSTAFALSTSRRPCGKSWMNWTWRITELGGTGATHVGRD